MENQTYETTIQPQKPKSVKKLLIGLLFGIIILGVLFSMFILGHDYVSILNTSDQDLHVVLTEETSQKETLLTINALSEGGKSFKNGVYAIDVKDTNNKIIRSLKNVIISDEDDKMTYIDALGNQTYMVVDVSSLYEGNEALADNMYIEAFDGQDPLYIPWVSDAQYYNPFDVIPAEIEEDDLPHVLIPFDTIQFAEMTEDQIFEAMDTYINQNIEKE